jgi:hypothetical protein
MIVCFNCFGEKTSWSLYGSNLISFSFLVCFEWFKTWWVCQLKIYKLSLYFKGKDATIQGFKFKILFYFNSSIIKHQTHLDQTPHIFPIDLRSRLWKLGMEIDYYHIILWKLPWLITNLIRIFKNVISWSIFISKNLGWFFQVLGRIGTSDFHKNKKKRYWAFS